MSFYAKLFIDEGEYTLLECSFDFNQSIGHDGRPCEIPRAGLIHLLLESTSNTDFVAWMVAEDMYKDGDIVFYNRDSMSSNKTLTFEYGICVSYHEAFSAEDTLPMKTRIAISARNIKINEIPFENNWIV